MNRFGSNLARLWNDPHLRWIVIVSLVLEVLSIWLPQYRSQFSDTQKVMLLYGIAVASNTGPIPVPEPKREENQLDRDPALRA